MITAFWGTSAGSNQFRSFLIDVEERDKQLEELKTTLANLNETINILSRERGESQEASHEKTDLKVFVGYCSVLAWHIRC